MAIEEMTGEEIKRAIEEKTRSSWIKAWFAFEVMAVDKETTENALKNHVQSLESAKDVFVFEKDFKPLEKVENPPKNASEAYSQIAEVRLFTKNLSSLINIVIAYGPSSIEILEPKVIKVSMDEVQSISNVVAGILHQFASAGIGGMVITAPKK